MAWEDDFKGREMSLPLGASPYDRIAGRMDDGTRVYVTARGTQYYASPTQNALSRPETFGERAWNVLSGIPKSLVQSAVNGFTAPGRALQGEPMTMGDVYDTAGLVSLGAAAMPAPKGALRSGAVRSVGDGNKFFHVVGDGYDGGDLTSLHARMGSDAYDEFARRWPDAGDMGEYHADNVFLFDDLNDARAYADYSGGKILSVNPDGLEIKYDNLEIPYGRKRGFPYVLRRIPAANLAPFVGGAAGVMIAPQFAEDDTRNYLAQFR